MELYHERLERSGKRVADVRFVIDVLLLLRPSMIRNMDGTDRINQYGMIKSYVRIGWRTMLRNKGYSLINIGGLAAGLAIVMLIGLWMYDEMSFNTYHQNYDRIGRVWVNHNFNGDIQSQRTLPYPLAEELRRSYSDFEHVALCSWSYGHFLSYEDVRLSKEGMFVQPDFLRLTSLRMIRGDYDALKDPTSIVVCESLAHDLFGGEDPIGKIIKIDLNNIVTVTGVFEDLPRNNNFSSTLWLAHFDLYATAYVRNPRMYTHWGDFSYQLFVTLKEGSAFDATTEKIRHLIVEKEERARETDPQLFIQPMSKWHLYNEFRNGVNTGGEITFVWLFGTIGAFVLVLACINFMNLSTARSETRAREIGLRKAIGSHRSQLIVQFMVESIQVVAISFVLALALVVAALPSFNELTLKQVSIPFGQPLLWLVAIVFLVSTALLAGSYPALLLSSFKTVSILKGTFRLDWFSGFSRRALVIFQFVVSITLVIGTITVYRQIQYAANRPVGYDKEGLITTYGYPFRDQAANPNVYDALRNQLLSTGAVVDMAKSSSPTTALYSYQSDFDWDGRDPQMVPNLGVVWCTPEYGKTIGMQIVQGRDFSRELASDTAALILNESAIDYMQLSEPVGKIVRFNRTPFRVIGVARNLLIESPYAPVGPLAMMVDYGRSNIITMRMNPERNAAENLSLIEPVFKSFRPDVTFEVQFTDQQFAAKFAREQRVGKIALVFTVLAILISCLGLFGLASFMAHQRTREIGIRKVSGASVTNLWSLLSRDFVVLVSVASVAASPIAWYAMTRWLEQYPYHTQFSVWVIVGSGVGAIALTLATVSYQAIRAARANPIRSLRSE